MGQAAGSLQAGFQAALQSASVDELRDTLAELPDGDRDKIQQGLLDAGFDLLVQLPEAAAAAGRFAPPERAPAAARMELSPFDRHIGNTPVGMVWFYQQKLDVFALLRALKETLLDYPVFCGRFASPPKAVELNNAGVQFQVRKSSRPAMSYAVSHLPPSDSRESSFFPTTTCEELFTPQGWAGGESPDTPLVCIRVTRFKLGGTAIGVSMVHSIGDADTILTFMKNWSCRFRGLGPELMPRHERSAVAALRVGGGQAAGDEKPELLKATVVLEGQPWIPEFIHALPYIAGDASNQGLVVPFPGGALQEMKDSASKGLEEGKFFSRDDVLTAHVWKAQCRVRIGQVGLKADSDELTTLIRAVNVRQKTDPKLGPGYCGNGILNICSDLKVRELLTMPLSEVALVLRASLQAQTQPEHLAASAQWMQKVQAKGETKLQWDGYGLSFLITSWAFDWEGIDFGARPTHFDHGCHWFLLTTYVPRPEGDGVNVYATGPAPIMERLSRLMTGKEENK